MAFRRQAACSGCPGADSDAVVHVPLVRSDWVGSGHGRQSQADGEGGDAADNEALHGVISGGLTPSGHIQWPGVAIGMTNTHGSGPMGLGTSGDGVPRVWTAS